MINKGSIFGHFKNWVMANKAVSLILFFLLFITPFIVADFGITQFEGPKVIVSEVLITFIFLHWLFSKNGKVTMAKKLIYLAIIALTIVDCIFLKTQTPLFGNVIRLQGIFLLWFMLIFSYLSANYHLPEIPWFLYIVILIAELLAMLLLLPINESGRYVGTMGEPNATAAFAIFIWPFAFFSIKKFDLLKKIGMIIMFLSVAGILFFTHSRSAMIAFGIQLIFILLQKTHLQKKLILFICLALILASYSLPFFENPLFENRAEIWKSALLANKNNVIIGNGFGNLENALHTSGKQLGLFIQYNYVDSAHNIFLDWWVQGGVVGVILLLGLVHLSLKTFFVKNAHREMVLLLGLLTVLSFNPASVASLLAFWWLIGKG